MSGDFLPSDFPIALTGVEKRFGPRTVLSGLELRVPRGKTFVIMGLSGTGKSVMLKIVAGLIRPDAGTVRVAGVDIVNASRFDLFRVRSKLGFMFQSGALIRWLTARENVALPLVESGVPESEADATARRSLDEVGLAAAADRYPDQLSGGEQKRVAFARATAINPEIILYDEPTTGLDPITKRTIDELIVRGRDKYGATSVVVSHDLRSALRVADVLALLYEGRIVVADEPRRFLASEHEIVRKFVEDGAPATGRFEVP